MLCDSNLRHDMKGSRFVLRAIFIASIALIGAPVASFSQTTVSGPGSHVVRDLMPLTLYQVTQDGTPIFTRVSSSQGVISFDTQDDGSYEVSTVAAEDVVKIKTKFTAMLTPAPGEVFVAPAELRLVAEAFDLLGPGPGTPGTGYCLDRIEFYVDDTRVAAMGCIDAEHSAFKTRVSGIGPGIHAVWARGYAGAEYYDSRPRTITVLPTPGYARTVTLNTDLDISGQDYVLPGTPDAPIKVIGNGHSIVGTPRTFSATFVDFSDLGDRMSTASNGIYITTNGDVTIDHCRFYSNDILAFTTNGGSHVSITNNLFSSNSRQPLGQSPDSNGGIQHGSWPALFLGGSSGNEKALQGNNFGAGWVDIRSSNWTIGGPTDDEGNVAMRARVGFFVSQSFTGTISHNYSHDIYYGGWSQA